MPAKQAFGCQRRVVVLGRIQHHIHHSINMPVCRGQSANVHAEATGDRRAYRVRVEFLALDFAGLEHILGQDPQACLVARIHPEIVHSPQKMALRKMHLGE